MVAPIFDWMIFIELGEHALTALCDLWLQRFDFLHIFVFERLNKLQQVE